MRNILAILICLFFHQSFGQRGISVTIDDINSDGAIDTMKSFYDGGSGFGGKFIEIVDGMTNEVIELNTYGCFCRIKNVVLFPPVLNKPENEDLFKAIRNEILPAQDLPDASLRWLINGTYYSKILKDNKYFDFIIDPRASWNKGDIKLPGTYYSILEGDTLRKLYENIDQLPEWYDSKTSKGCVIYYGHNHYRNPSGDSLMFMNSNRDYEVFRTSHGVVVKKDTLYKWVFVSDVDLTGAPNKLRWESIKKVKLIDNYLLIQQYFPLMDTYNIYTVNIETGICGRIKSDISESGDLKKNDIWTTIMSNENPVQNPNGTHASKKMIYLFNELDNQHIAH